MEREERWQNRAQCLGVDTDLFFPERGQSMAEARAVCAGCPVRVQCLEYALANGEKCGVWGGKSERERRRIRKERSPTTKLTVVGIEGAVDVLESLLSA